MQFALLFVCSPCPADITRCVRPPPLHRGGDRGACTRAKIGTMGCYGRWLTSVGFSHRLDSLEGFDEETMVRLQPGC